MSETLSSNTTAPEPVAGVIRTPLRVMVKEIVESRYPPDHLRPDSWDHRKAGVDIVRTDLGQIKLSSDGGQSPPRAGWVILLTGGDQEHGFLWTLYGIHRN